MRRRCSSKPARCCSAPPRRCPKRSPSCAAVSRYEGLAREFPSPFSRGGARGGAVPLPQASKVAKHRGEPHPQPLPARGGEGSLSRNPRMSSNLKCASCGGSIVDGACEDCGRVPAGENLIGVEAPAATAPTRSSSSRRTRPRGTTSSSIRVTVAVGQAAAKRVPATRGSTSRRRALGGGLVSLPFQPTQEPLDLLMKDPTVPAGKRICQKCGTPALYDKGFCTYCGAEYNFVPGLKAGDLVAGQYRVKGPVAYGGLGWIYLGFDELLNRWVVLKGLLNSKDEEAAAAAMAERQFLAAVKHPKIVQIFNFTHQGVEGFIVMEYVGGKTIAAIRRERGPLPVAEAIAYILGILPAFAYLHGQNLVYCDFKPNNFMLEGDDVKLIDMGAVRRIGDPDGAVFGTVGYMAPEADQDPIAVSDLYTIGRSLAELVMNFKMAR